MQQYNQDEETEEYSAGKGKGEMEIDKHLNAEFQRLAGRDKKAFPGNQCKEIEEKNRMGKPRDLFKKIRERKIMRESLRR